MKKNLLAFRTCAFALALGLVACGDDSSSNGPFNTHDGTDISYQNPDVDYGTMTDARDGQVYKTVTIGTQTWMAENLNYAYTGVKYNYGGVYTSDSTSWCYGNDPSKCATYGRLYTWAAAMDSAGIVDPSGAGKGCGYGVYCDAASSATKVRGVCPSGWHLPSHREFEELINFIDPSFGYNHTDDASSSTAGHYLKSKSGWNSNGNGTDAYGFSALPGGFRDIEGDFHCEGIEADFLSSGELNDYYAFLLHLHYYDDYADLNWDGKVIARSVRCLKD